MAEGRVDPARALGLPYDGVKTPQVKGREREVKMAKDRGARPHPMSGAGRIKDDASDDQTQYEFKSVGKKHTLDGWALDGLFVRAIRQGKTPIYVVEFEDAQIVATITLERKPRG